MSKDLSKTALYSTLLQLVKLVVLYENGIRISHFILPRLTTEFSKFITEIAESFEIKGVPKAITEEGLMRLASDYPSEIEYDHNMYSFRLMDGEEFDKLYVIESW